MQFSFAEIRREIDSMAKVARQFLEPAANTHVIPDWLQQLTSFSNSKSQNEFNWAVPIDCPIQTIQSRGEYEPGAGGKHTVFGTLSAIWDIRLSKSRGKKKKKHVHYTHFELTGRASTRITVFEFNPKGNHREIARWRFEIGDSTSPGCHFHIQIMGEEGDVNFPKSMPVPRLPGLFVTPMDSLEFLLAEIFQDRWKQHASQESPPMQSWAGCQRRRLINVLSWQRKAISESAGSPWTYLKSQKPDKDFVITEAT